MSKTSEKQRDRHINIEIHKLFWQANFMDKYRLVLTYVTRISATAAYNIFIPLASAYGIQAIINKQFGEVKKYAALVILLGVFYGVCWAIGGVAISKQAIMGSRFVQNKVFANFLNKDYDFYSNSYYGSLGAQAARLRDAFNNYGELVTLSIPKQVTIVVAGVVIIAIHSLVLAGLTLLLFAIVLGYTILTGTWRLKYRRKTSEASSEVAGVIGDALSHGSTVKSFAMEDYEVKRLRKPLAKWEKEQYRTWITFVPADVGRMMLAAIATALLLLYSADLYQHGKISITFVILIQLYVIRLVASTLDIGEIVKRYEEAMSNAYDPVKTMHVPVLVVDPDKPKKIRKTNTHTLELGSVSYRYPEAPERTNAVDGFSLKIKPGQKIGLVGYSGSGKTTLTKLLMRFMDVTEGRISIDDIDIRQLKQSDLRSILSYVPQEPLLFHRSIMENISYAKPEATEQEVLQAAKIAYVDEFVADLPEGYQTLVGERGIKLSGGQRQRVAIARALLKDSPVLVLDEATSALDSKSEKYIQDGLHKLMESRASLVIAHRLSTVQRMDNIVVMDKGKIVQMGTHKELLEKGNGIYAKLWEHQSGGYIGDK